MPEPLGKQQLESLTLEPFRNKELWIDGEGTLRTKEGSWGGRVARNIKIAAGEERSAKQTAYRQAKEHVLESLISVYGKEIGHKAFRAGVGRARADGGWETSSNHPLTGRHVARMLAAAESLRHAGLADWLAEKQELVGAKVPLIERQPLLWTSRDGEPGFEPLADRIRREVGDGDKPGLWLVTATRSDGERLELGVHYDPRHPERVEVRDAEGHCATVTHLGLAARLAAAGGDAVTRTSLRGVKAGEAPDPPQLDFRQQDGGSVAEVQQLIPESHWEDLASGYQLKWLPTGRRPELVILPTAGWRDLTVTERDGLARVLDTATFERVHQVISGRLGSQAPSLESIEVAVDRTADGDLVLTFRAPLPRDAVVSFPGERRWGDAFDLALRLKVPKDALGSDRPEVVFGPLTISEQPEPAVTRHHFRTDRYDQATAGWLLLAQQGESKPQTGPIVQAMGRRQEHLVFDDTQGAAVRARAGERLETGDAARDIEDALLERTDESERQQWQLDVRFDNGVRRHWGIAIDRRDPGLVHVFDPSRGQFDVPRERLGDWLAANLDHPYRGQLQGWSLDQPQLDRVGQDLARWSRADQPDDLQPLRPVRLGPPVWRAQDPQAPDWGALVAALQEDAERQGSAGLWLLPLRTEDGGSEPVGLRLTPGDRRLELRVHGQTVFGEPDELAAWLETLARDNALRIDGPLRRIE